MRGKYKNLRSSDNRTFDRQSEGPGLDTQRSGSVPFFTKNCLKKNYIVLLLILNIISINMYFQ